MLTDSEVQKLKKKHGKLFMVTVEADGDMPELVYILRRPTRHELGLVVSLSESDPLQGSEVLLNSCLLDGDKDMLQDNSVFMSVAKHLQTIMKERVSKLGEL